MRIGRLLVAVTCGLALAPGAAVAASVSASFSPETLTGAPPWTITESFSFEAGPQPERLLLAAWKGQLAVAGPAQVSESAPILDDELFKHGCYLGAYWAGRTFARYDVVLPPGSASTITLSYRLERFPFIGERFPLEASVVPIDADELPQADVAQRLSLPGPALAIAPQPSLDLRLPDLIWRVPLPTGLPVRLRGYASREIAGQLVDFVYRRGRHSGLIARARVNERGRFSYDWHPRTPGGYEVSVRYRVQSPAFSPTGEMCPVQLKLTGA
jgi:hypothetical protein